MTGGVLVRGLSFANQKASVKRKKLELWPQVEQKVMGTVGGRRKINTRGGGKKRVASPGL